VTSWVFIVQSNGPESSNTFKCVNIRAFRRNRSHLTARAAPKVRTTILILLIILGSALVFSPHPAFALAGPPAPPPVSASLGCGSSVNVSTILTSDVGPCAGGYGLVIGNSGISLDCNYHTITDPSVKGSSLSGVYLKGFTGVTVKNCKISGFGVGVYVLSSSYDLITGNQASSSTGSGFELQGTTRSILSANTATNNGQYGFYLASSSDQDTLTGNDAEHNQYGFYLSGSSYDTLGTSASPNTADSNEQNGFYLYSSAHNTLASNSATGNANFGFYLGKSSDNALTSNAASFTSNEAIANGNAGFYLNESSHNTLTSNSVNLTWNSVSLSSTFKIWKGDSVGFYVHASNSNKLVKNTASTSTSAGTGPPQTVGILIDGSNYNVLKHNAANGNQEGFELSAASRNTLTSNTATKNNLDGFIISTSYSNKLTSNTSNGNFDGFNVGYDGSSNRFKANTADNNKNFGYYDTTDGFGTKHTANTYTGDHCSGDGTAGSWGGLYQPSPYDNLCTP
jgi:parallel beta-helix repeat protein